MLIDKLLRHRRLEVERLAKEGHQRQGHAQRQADYHHRRTDREIGCPLHLFNSHPMELKAPG